jgi:hypothetical protein
MQCPNCNNEREPKDFKRFATLAQTRAWLKKPTAQKRMIYVGSICNACYKQVMRKPNEITPSELRKRLLIEGKNPEIVDALHESRVKLGRDKLRKGALRTLKLRRKDLFVPVIKELNALVTKVKVRRNYLFRTCKDPYAIRFLDVCLAQTITVRDRVLQKKKNAGTPPDDWRDLIDTFGVAERENAYIRLLGKYKDRFSDIKKAFAKDSV